MAFCSRHFGSTSAACGQPEAALSRSSEPSSGVVGYSSRGDACPNAWPFSLWWRGGHLGGARRDWHRRVEACASRGTLRLLGRRALGQLRQHQTIVFRCSCCKRQWHSTWNAARSTSLARCDRAFSFFLVLLSISYSLIVPIYKH